MDNGESVNWTERWGRKKGRRSKDGPKGSILFVSLFPLSFLSLSSNRVSSSLSLYIYIYVYALRYFFVQFWLTRRLIPLREIQYQHIYQVR